MISTLEDVKPEVVKILNCGMCKYMGGSIFSELYCCVVPEYLSIDNVQIKKPDWCLVESFISCEIQKRGQYERA